MKKISILLAFIALLLNTKTNAQLPDWSRVLQVNTVGAHEVNSITTDADNVYAVARFSDQVTVNGQNYTSKGDYDLLIVKTTNAGAITWVKQIEVNGGTSKADAIAVDSTGGIYITATYSGTINFNSTTITSDGANNSFMAKFDSNGDFVWVKTFLNSDNGVSEIAIDNSQNVFLISKTSKFIKFSSTGEILWTQTYPVGYLYGIAISGTNLYLSGLVKTSTTFGPIIITDIMGYYSGFLLKADLDGNYTDSVIIRNNNYGASINDVIIDKDGNLLLTGFYSANLNLRNVSIPNTSKERRTYIAKCDPSFNFSWVKTSNRVTNYSSSPSHNDFRIYCDNNNTIFQYGATTAFFRFGTVDVNSNNSGYLVKFDQNGDAISSYPLINSHLTRLAISKKSKIVIGKNTNDYGETRFGNVYLTLSDNTLTKEWQSIFESTSPGFLRILNIQYDNAYNIYVKAKANGKVDFFGTTLNFDTLSTVVAKLDVYGKLVWYRAIEDQDPQKYGSTFVLDKDNNAITIGLFKNSLTIEGQTINTSNAEYEGYVVKFSPTGSLVWVKPFELGMDISDAINVTVDNSGNVIFTGVDRPNNFLVKLNSAGEKLWSKTFSMESNYNSIVSADNNGSIYMASEIHLEWGTGSAVIGDITLNQSVDDGSTVIVKFDPNGNTVWAKTIGGKTGDSFTDGWPCYIKNDSDGNTYVWGVMEDGATLGITTVNNIYGYGYSLCLFKVNSTGDIVWAKPMDMKIHGFNYGRMMDFDSEGNIFVAGDYRNAITIEGTEYTPQGACDNFIAKYTSEGEFLGVKTLPFSTTNGIEAISIAPNDALSVGGASTSSSTLGNSTIIKKSGSNCMIATIGKAYLLTATPNELTIGATQGSTADLNISSNIEWSVSTASSWLSLDKTSGTGNAAITISAEENPTTSVREASLKLTSPQCEDVTIKVTQLAAEPFISVSTTSINVDAEEGSTNTFNITSNTSWTLSSNQSWLTTNTSSGNSNTSISVVANKNIELDTRSAIVTISSNGLEDKLVTVIQDAALPYLNVSNQNINVSANDGSTSSFTITSNTSWNINCDQAWLTIDPNTNSGSSTINITASANPTTNIRQAIITVSSTGLENKTITVTQDAALPYLNVSNQNITLTAGDGSTSSFSITSNTSWNLNCDQTWLTIDPNTNSGSSTINITASGNPTTNTRQAIITVSSTGLENKTITVTQDAALPYLNISTQEISIAANEGSTNTFTITSNTTWNLVCNQSWLTVNPTSGSGNLTINMTAASNPITSPRSSTITVTATGIEEKTITITQDAKPSSITDMSTLNNYVYPNPVKDWLNFKNFESEISVTIWNSNGKLILQEDVSDLKINLGNLTKGIYFIKIDSRSKIYTSTFIKL